MPIEQEGNSAEKAHTQEGTFVLSATVMRACAMLMELNVCGENRERPRLAELKLLVPDSDRPSDLLAADRTWERSAPSTLVSDSSLGDLLADSKPSIGPAR